MRCLPILTLLICCLIGYGQAVPTTPQETEATLQQKQEMTASSLVKHILLKNIGPSAMSGRVVDLDVNPDNPIEFYAAYASGGLWYTANNGTSFTSVMDNAETQNIGDIAVDWKNGTIWVGTGENNASRSSYAGIGILKSKDKGKTWQHMGLTDSHHIGRILIDPNNGDEVVVAVTGHLYSSNEERGIYKTSDGGKTWQKTLFVNPETGVIDMVHAPNNFNIMYASSWEKDRKAWDFLGSGSGSGIYKSTDAGNSWEKISNEGSGFPTGLWVGRIGLAAFNENIIYVVHDNQNRRTESEEKDSDILTKDDFKTLSKDDFLKLEDKKTERVSQNKRFSRKIPC